MHVKNKCFTVIDCAQGADRCESSSSSNGSWCCVGYTDGSDEWV